ncbi:MAG: sigma-70 family RNA polymerase sigma factor [Planctomycetota bacterium]
MTRRTEPVPNPEALISHAGFIRVVAQRLLLDDHEVDDVVQQTLLAALEKPPEREVKPWLAAVASNLARMRRRTEGRVKRREKVAARPEATAATSEIAERLDMQKRLVEAVTALDGPYRDVIVLRYFDELPPREVAQRLDIPVETVRTRTRRALEQLRGRLDARPGGRQAWQLALLPLALPPARTQAAVGTTAAIATGVIGMKSIVALAAALIAAVAFLWSETSQDAERTVERAAESGERGERTVASTTGEPRAGVRDAPKESGPSLPRDFEFQGVVVDSDGNPIAGAVVTGQVRGDHERDLQLESDERGALRFDGTTGDASAFVNVRHPDFAPGSAYLSSWSAEPTRIVLRHGEEMNLRVLSPRGAGVPGAPCEATLHEKAGDTWQIWNHEVEGATDRAGLLPLGRLPAESGLTLTIDHDGFAHFRKRFEPEDLRTGELTVQLAEGGTVRGRVLDPDGQPVAGAIVRSPHREARTDAEGSYVLRHVVTDGVKVTAEHASFAPAAFGASVGWGKSVPVQVDEGAVVDGVEITLGRATRVRGRIVDEEGNPVAGFKVQSYCGHSYSQQEYPVTGEDGRFVAGPYNLRKPTSRWILQRSKSKTHRLAGGMELPIRAGQTLDAGDITVESRPRVRLRVVMPDGTPAPPRVHPHVMVTLVRRHGRAVFHGFVSAQQTMVRMRPDATQEAMVDPGVFRLQAEANDGLLSAAATVDTQTYEGEEIELKLVASVTLRGTFRVNGVERSGHELALIPAALEQPWHAGSALRTHSRDEGAFEFRVAEPGEYLLGATERAKGGQRKFTASPSPRRVTVGAEPIEGLRIDAVLVREGAVVRGRVVDATTGRAIPQASFNFQRYKFLMPQHALMTSSWDREGKFEEELDTPGSYTVTVRADGYSAWTSKRFQVKQQGEIDLGTIKLPSVFELAGVVKDAQGVPVPYTQVHLLGGAGQLRASVFTDSGGRFRIQQSDVGLFNVFAVSPRHPVAVMRAVSISQDKTEPIQIRLPAASPLTVRVRDENGQPIAGAKFVYSFPAVAPFTSKEFGSFEPPSYGANESDTEGVVRKPYMPAARVTIQVSKKGFGLVRKVIETKKGEPTELEITLTRK